MELHEELLSRERIEGKCVDTEALHHPEGPRDRSIGHSPHDHVSGWCLRAMNECEISKKKRGDFTFRLQANEVPKIIVCRLALRDLIMRFGFDGMNKVRKLDRFLNEEDGNIIPDQIPISLLRVKLGGKAANVSDGVLRQKA